MSEEDPYVRALREPDFLRHFAAEYTGAFHPLEALRRYAESDGSTVNDDAAATLYGSSRNERARQQVVDALVAQRDESARVERALRAADAEDPGPATPAQAAPPAVTSPQAGHHPERQRTAVLLVIGVLASIGVGIAIGRALPTAAAPLRPLSTPREVPASITFDNRDGQQALLVVRSVADPRSLVTGLPPVTGGYDVGTACLAASRRPVVLPDETVLLLSSTGRQLARLVVGCDGDERRVHVLPPVDVTQTVRIVIDLDAKAVGAAWVTLNPAGT